MSVTNEFVDYLTRAVDRSLHDGESYLVSDIVAKPWQMEEVANELDCEVAHDWRKHVYRFTPKD